MSQAESKNESKKPTLLGSDILFECGQCGKSLAIDCRGAGLNIRCPQCAGELEVPIPDGFDLTEIDKAISDSVVSGKEIDEVTSGPAVPGNEIKVARIFHSIKSRQHPPAEALLKAPMPGPDAVVAPSSDAAGQINKIKAELEIIRVQQQDITLQNADMLKIIQDVSEQVEGLREALDNLGAMPGARTGHENDETQKIT